jgi:UDP-N-acetylmuramyl pentapeptide phosphotransferase/UDP-N-acetylglucosamine-1-phosphate transferase
MVFESLIEILKKPMVLCLIGVLIAYALSVKIFPALIQLSLQKNLVEEFNERKVHKATVSNLGGVGIYITFVILLMTFFAFAEITPESYRQRPGWIAGLTIVFFLGLKDDLIGLSPSKKFLGQITAVFLIVFGTGLRIESLAGIFGVYELPYLASVLFTFFVFILLINAFNLIDGIDGLAGSVALVGCLIFGVFFLNLGSVNLALSGFVLSGAVLGFLRFNLSANKKIFMGDSGSMVLGFLIAGQAIHFLNAASKTPGIIPNAPVIVLAILSFPLLDTLRVFLLRALRKKSPFMPDNNHLHHVLLKLRLSHKQATAILLLQNLLVFTLAFLTQDFPIHLHLSIVLGLGIIIYLVPILSFKYLNTQFSNWYMNLFESETR